MWTGNRPLGRTPALRANRGLTYLGLLLAIAITGAVLASAGVVWHTQVQRERERELLYIGGEIRAAIGRFYNAGARQYPQTFDDLLRDPRQPSVVRHLRKAYHDPITGNSEWGIVRGPGDSIMGVYSTSDERPIKQAGFDPAEATFENSETYANWKFVFVPKAKRRAPVVRGAPNAGNSSLSPFVPSPALTPGPNSSGPTP
jgi:type II secretory pathway pseudopilin PulG